MLQHIIYRILVENKFIQGRRRNKVRHIAVFVRKIVLVASFVLSRKLIIGNALFQKLRAHLNIMIRHKHLIAVYSCFVLIGIRWYAALHLEKFIGVPVHLGFGRCRQAYQIGIKVFKNSPVLFEYAAMRFIHNNQIKMSRRKELAALLRFDGIDGIQDRRVRGKYDAGVLVLGAVQEVAQGHVRQMRFKIVSRLLDQRRPVRQKKGIGNIAAAGQHVGETRGRSGFAGACGHDQQRPSVSILDIAADSANGFFLIVAVGNTVLNHHGFQLFLLGPAAQQLLQIRLGKNPAGPALRRSQIVPNVGIKAVGHKQNRTPAGHFFQTICVQLGLLGADLRVFGGSFRLHDGQRQTVLAVQHIVRIAHSGIIGHARQFHFFFDILAKDPAQQL